VQHRAARPGNSSMQNSDLVHPAYLRIAALAASGGLLISGLAFVVMGTNFGFFNVTPVSVVPGFFVGFTATFVISLLVVRSRRLLAERLAFEQKMTANLRNEVEENRRLQRRLQETNERNRTVIDAAPTGIIVHVEGRVEGCGGPDEVRVRRLRRDGSVFWSESIARADLRWCARNDGHDPGHLGPGRPGT
jgi:PAS domain-containing protein